MTTQRLRNKRGQLSQELPLRLPPRGDAETLLAQACDHHTRGNWDRATRLAAYAVRQAVLEGGACLPEAQEELAHIRRGFRPMAAIALLQRAARGYERQGLDGPAYRCHRLVVEILLDENHTQEAMGALAKLEVGDDTLVLWGRLNWLLGDLEGVRGVVELLYQRGPHGWPPGVPRPAPTLPPPPKLGADEFLLLAMVAEGPDQARAYWRLAHRAAAEVWDVHAMDRVERDRPRIGGISA